MSSSAENLFSEVVAGDNNPNKCTPKITENFVGIKINTPDTVQWAFGDKDKFTGAFAKMMVCGIYRLAAKDLFDTDGFNLTASLIATDSRTHKSFTAKMAADSLMLEDPNPRKPAPEELEGVFETGYFNINALALLPLPEKDAEYTIFVMFKHFKSNVAVVKLQQK